MKKLNVFVACLMLMSVVGCSKSLKVTVKENAVLESAMSSFYKAAKCAAAFVTIPILGTFPSKTNKHVKKYWKKRFATALIGEQTAVLQSAAASRYYSWIF